MEYIQLGFLLAASASVSAFLTPFLRRIAMENGLVDLPSERKIHRQVVPRIGGVAIAMSFFSAVVFGYSLFQENLAVSLAPLAGLAIGGVFILLVGLLDDINSRGLEASKKLIGQIVAALTLIPFGFVIETLNLPFIGIVHLGFPLGLLLTVLWMVAITNAVNLTDGMDGLCSGLAIIAAVTLGVFALLSGKLLVTIVLVTLLGSTLGFLFHNWHPARIFMGDCGAMFLGFILAAVSIEIAFKNGAAGSSVASGPMFVPVLVFGLPILDTAVALLRRLLMRLILFVDVLRVSLSQERDMSRRR